MTDTYTPAQISEYLAHISFPSPPKASSPAPTLRTLARLVTHHLATVPFESISLHYSPTRQALSVDPHDLFRKVVAGPGGRRGGYCMETNMLFGRVLEGLGFDVMSVGARVSFATQGMEGEGFSGFHMANIVTVNDRRYLVDIGFGANTPLYPLPFPSSTAATAAGDALPSLTTDNRRLTLRRLLPTSHPSSPPAWIYSHRASPSDPWIDAYALAPMEFHVSDFAVMNYWTMSNSFFAHTVICVRTFFPSEAWFVERRSSAANGVVRGREDEEKEEEEEMAGILILHQNTLKYRTLTTPTPKSTALQQAPAQDGASRDVAEGKPEFGEDVLLMTFATEDERVGALRDFFGVVLSEEDRKGIEPLSSAIRSS